MSALQKYLSRSIWVVLGLIMLLPVYIDSDFFFPYIFSKTWGFRILVEILVLLFLLWLYFKKDSKIKIDWLTSVFFIFLIFMFVSSLFGGNFYFSFWSSIERSEGLLLWLHLFAFFVVLRNFISSKKQWTGLMDAFFIAAQLVAIFGFLQYLGVDFINKTGLGENRVASTIGNAAYLAGYMLFAAFFGLYLFLSRKNRYLKVAYLAAVLLDLFVMAQTGTRGAFIAVVLGVILFIIYNLFRLPHKKTKYILLTIGLIFCLVGVVIYSNKSSNFVKNNFILRRVTSISLSERTAQTRLMTWNSAWQGFKEKPILGYGNENFYVVFNKYFNPKIYSHAGSRVWFDRAHNIFIDHLITGGVIGFLLYSILIIGPTWLLIRRCRRRSDPETDKDKFNFSDQILALAIITFIIQGLLVFEALVTYMPLLIILALISQRYIKHRHGFFNKKVILGSLVVYIIALVPIMYIVNIKEARASLTVIKALRLQNINIDQSLDTYFKAINYRASSAHEFRRRVAEYADGLIVNRMITPEKAIAVTEKIDNELRMRFEENPSDVANYMLAMRHYNYTYILDPSRLFEVAKIGELAIAHSPTRPHIYYEIGYADLYLYQWLRDQGLTEEAKIYQESVVKNFDKAIELNDAVRESYINMIMILLASDQGDKIQPYIDALVAKEIWPAKITPQDLTRLMHAAVNAKNFEWAIYFMELAIDNDIHNPDNYIAMALSYANLGMNEEAIATAEKIKEFGGTYLQQAEEFIAKIRNGTFIKEADR